MSSEEPQHANLGIPATLASSHCSRQGSCDEVPVQDNFKSAPQTPLKRANKPIFRTVPDTPKHCRLLSDDHGLDLEILTHKLQLYQLELEEVELRFRHRRMNTKEAEDVAAAARFRNGIEKLEAPAPQVEVNKKQAHSRSTSTHSLRPFPNRTDSLRVTKMIRAKRPTPLYLEAMPHVPPQEVQSAALPLRRKTSSNDVEAHKRHWRRTTISAGRNPASTIVMTSSSGQAAEYDFVAEIPPVPSLSSSRSTIVSPSVASPLTPQPTEDQIRRELETFALEEGPNIQLSRRSSIASRRRLPAAFIPDDGDRVIATHKALPEIPSVVVATPTKLDSKELEAAAEAVEAAQKKGFFSRFERRNEVDALLDLYMTDDQLVEEKSEKKKANKSRRYTIFKKW